MAKLANEVWAKCAEARVTPFCETYQDGLSTALGRVVRTKYHAGEDFYDFMDKKAAPSPVTSYELKCEALKINKIPPRPVSVHVTLGQEHGRLIETVRAKVKKRWG